MKQTAGILMVLVIALVAIACSDEAEDSNLADGDMPSADGDEDLSDAEAPESDSAEDDATTEQEQQEALPIKHEVEVSQAYLERKAAYLEACIEYAPTSNRHGQVCAAYGATGQFNTESIWSVLEDKIDLRKDTSDFDMNSIMRTLYLDSKNPSLPDDLREKMKQSVLDFKYWLDEPGEDKMCYWSENHQILFHAIEYMAGLLYPDEIFTNSGMTGKEHVLHAKPLIHRWLDFRGRFGFSEWHSNVYFKEDIPPLINIVDVADDEAIRTKAKMALDVLTFDMLNNHYKGLFATTHGRTYPSKHVGGLNDSTRAGIYLLTGIGEEGTEIEDLSKDDFIAAYLATSDIYAPPAILEDISNDSRDFMEHRQRDGIFISDGPDLGIGYTDLKDIVFWWGMTGYAAPDIIMGSFDLVDQYDMWDGYFWESLSFLKAMTGNPYLIEFSNDIYPVSQGVVLESVNTYTYRTPYYQLSGAQDWKPGGMTAQVLIWKSAIDKDSYVFTTYPATDGSSPIGDGLLGTFWTGGIVPRATLYKNVGIFQYRKPELSDTALGLFGDGMPGYSHAYFPRATFDEVVERGNWVIGKKGEAYVALYSQNETEWAEEEDYDLRAYTDDNVWIIEYGDAENNGDFESFVGTIENASVDIGDSVVYQSPSLGSMEVGWEGPLTVEGESVDIGPYPRWDNRYCYQEFDVAPTVISFQERKLVLDFETPSRHILKTTEE